MQNSRIQDGVNLQGTSDAMKNCEREAIHQIQAVQAHGFVIVCDAASGKITFVSENTSSCLGMPEGDMLGTCVCEFVDDTAQATLEKLRTVAAGSPTLVDIKFKSNVAPNEHFEVLAHKVDGMVVIETIPFQDTVLEHADGHRQIEDMVKAVGELRRHQSLDDFLMACASEIRQLSGYQRVFIYRFLPDWSGEVLAESVDPGCETRFLGLRFPASDIPAQARALFKINLLRIVGDVDASPVRLLPAVPGAILDQSNSLLRSPSPMHLRYLQNMGTKATMTISLLNDGELWGMVSCHHHEPKLPAVGLRRITKLLCAMLSEVALIRLNTILHHDLVSRTLRFKNALDNLTIDINSGRDFLSATKKSLTAVAALMNTQKYGLMIAGQWICNPALGSGLLDFLQQKAKELPLNTVFSTHQLPQDANLPNGECDGWAGALILKVPGPQNSYLILLRGEIVQLVKWAGAPGKEQVSLTNGLKVMGPRQSFETWTQRMEGRSDPWSSDEQHAIIEIAKVVGDAHQTYQGQLMQSELRMLGACMEHLNDMVVVTSTLSISEPGPEIVYVNQAFVTMTGFSREDVIGHSPRILQGPATDRDQLDRIRRAMLSWQSVTVELINYKKNGDPFWVEISLAPIADSTGWFTHWIAIERNIDERRRTADAIQQLVNYDQLTGLPNRRLLMDRLPVAVSLSKRHNRNGALLFVDLDNFKDLNDTEGHQMGDELLKQVATRLGSIIRFEDTVARLGGDEFVIMLENLGSDESEAAATAEQIAEKIVTFLAQPYQLSGHLYSTTASLGISLFMGQDREQSVEELLKQADFAMYQSKAAGRNTWRFFDPATQAALVEKNALEADLKNAFAKGQLELHYQPIVDGARRITGAEALMRWKHPTRGWVSPLEFIAIAETCGLIVPIGKWAIDQACQLLVDWSGSPQQADWSLAVNVSARQIRQADFVPMVKDLIMRHGCNPRLLKLELTESLLQHDFDATIAKMDALRAIGVAFSIDDFGTGYSSLAYLQRLPISVLKIDRSFVRDIGEDRGDMGICMMILALGKTLNLSIVAEGVETMEQFDFLKLHGCDKFQGYLFSKAVPADQLGYPDVCAERLARL